jgi:diguanylate cyclase (GGDEF)-like protein/PAS domain S-box-containing protein
MLSIYASIRGWLMGRSVADEANDAPAVLTKSRDQELADTVVRLTDAFESISQGLVIYDADRRLTAVNAQARAFFGRSPDEVRVGMTLREVLAVIIGNGAYPPQADLETAFAEFDAIISRGKPVDYIRELAGGRLVAISHRPLRGGGWMSTCEDITDRRRVERRIEYLARHDILTDLANEMAFREALKAAVGARRPDKMVAVLCVNLSRFNMLIDTLGRGIGDLLLKAIAKRLKDCVQDGDTLARLSDDEFAIVRPVIDGPDTAETLAHQLLDACGEPLTIDGHELTIRVHIGISMVPTDGEDADTALKCAHIALHRARNDGQHDLRFFEPAMDALLQARRTLDLELRQALRKEQFRLYYQPIVDLNSGEICGFEALLRWNHSLRGIVAPDVFLSVAEDTGLITAIGVWVLRRACADAATWSDKLRVAVNLSPTQFRTSDLYTMVVDSLAAAGLPASRLELEITESVLLQDIGPIVATLHRLRGLGIRIVMDDFGTGYSSLAYLRSFPFDKIKIDQSFVRDVADQADSLAIVRAAIGLGRGLGMTTTAEGVETRQQMASVRAEGCQEAQGYLISPPRPAEEIGELMTQWDTERALLFVAGSDTAQIPQFPTRGPIFAFADIIQAANDVVIVTTADLDPPGPRIVYVNAAFTALTGYTADEVIGRTPRLLQGPGTSTDAIRAIGVALRAGRAIRQTVLNYDKAGTEYWLDLRIMPLRDAAGFITHFAAIQRDVSAERRRMDDLEHRADTIRIGV